MARPREILLDKDAPVTERRLRLARRGFQRSIERAGLFDHSHPPTSTPPAAAFGENRVSNFFANARNRGRISSLDARNHGHPGVHRETARRYLVAHRLHRRGRRSDKNQSRIFDRARERRTLGEKSIARMNRVGAGRARRKHHRIYIKVALGGRRGTEEARLVSRRDVRRSAIGLGENCYGLDAEQARATNHSQRNLAAIRDEQFFERAFHHIRKTPKLPPAGIGAFNEAAMPSASALRVSTGSRTPSSHSRALE